MVDAAARRRVQDDLGREFATDLQEDVQLQRAVYEACRRTGVDAGKIREYAYLPEKFAQATTVEAPTPK